MKTKLRHDDKVCCPYYENATCNHRIRCIRMRNQECKYYHMDEALMKVQIRVVISPSKALNDSAHKKYLRRVKHG